ncbi:MAG: class I SAM-dependent rRNA methyltransferase [Elusimicrobiota bacterium]
MDKKIVLKRNEEKRILSGHPWVFSNEIKEIKGEPLAGDIVRLLSASGVFLGSGFYNPHSLIAVRLLSRKAEEINPDFWKKKILAAREFRQRIYPGLKFYRAVFGESDGLPGLIVDQYDQYLTVQFLSAGWEKNREQIISVLREVFSPLGIIARNDSALRKLEGLEEKVEVLFGQIPQRIKIEENGCFFWADLAAGQKTGFFFDQRENRMILASYCRGKNVLDCFCHTGAFGINAFKAGAKKVEWVDSSLGALKLAEENAQLNGIGEQFNGVVADIFDYLESLKEVGKFDLIILDPPAMIKNRKNFAAGYKAYKRLNSLALQLLLPGGLLATSSCSHHLGRQDFRDMLQDSAVKAGKPVRLLEFRSQARDHPILLSMPETEYLKFAIVEVI